MTVCVFRYVDFAFIRFPNNKKLLGLLKTVSGCKYDEKRNVKM